MTSGGYRQPNNPAPVSGPGMLSKRTDGGAIDGMTQPVRAYTGGAYGNNKDMRDQQEGADIYATPTPPTPTPAPSRAKSSSIIPPVIPPSAISLSPPERP